METELEIPEPLASLFKSGEVYCVAECCGLNAFDLTPEIVRFWLESHDLALLATAQQQLDEITATLSEAPEEFYHLPLFCETASGAFWASLFTTWKVALEQGPTTPLPEPPTPEPVYPTPKSQALDAFALLGCGIVGATPIVLIILLLRWLLHR